MNTSDNPQLVSKGPPIWRAGDIGYLVCQQDGLYGRRVEFLCRVGSGDVVVKIADEAAGAYKLGNVVQIKPYELQRNRPTE